jgi:hypothetical protein
MSAGTNRIMSLLIVVFVLLTAATTFAGKIIYVDDDVPADFNNIQAAIDDSNDGDVVIVTKGRYFENINFKGKNITLTSTNPTDWAVVRSTIIDGVTFRGTEDANCTLTGFKVGHIFGFDRLVDPTADNHTHATISYCLLEDVVIVCGVVMGCCDGRISNCVIVNNQTNTWCYSPTVNMCNGLIKNCTIASNISGVGGTPTIQNCIIYDNWAEQIRGTPKSISYSNVQGGWLGTGNIDADPCFVRLADWPVRGDYHLKSQAGRWDANEGRWMKDDVTSPCIDAGNTNSPIGFEPFPNGGIINMGAYGGTAEASKSYFGQPLCETIVAGDINGDCKVNFQDFRLMALHWLEDNNTQPPHPPMSPWSASHLNNTQ